MKARVSVKLAVVFLLTAVILLALLAVGITISSRENYRQEAVKAIAQSYASGQTFVGPAITRHYQDDVEVKDTDSKGVVTKHTEKRDERDYFFPQVLTMTGELVPSERRHGLYRVTVYELRAHLEANFNFAGADTKKDYDDRTLRFAVSDVRGIVGLPTVTVNGTPVVLKQDQTVSGGGSNSGTSSSPDLLSRTEAAIPSTMTSLAGAVNVPDNAAAAVVKMDFVLAGTQALSIAPIGDLNHITLTSPWRTPLFAGKFLPRTRTIDASGFRANWEISSLASTAQIQAQNGSLTGSIDTFDINLNEPTDPYTLSDRATKYGVLFVLLTFGGFFIFEVMKQLPIHPVQYLLVGFALSLFFLLLISLSEHIAFGAAYLVSSVASIGLLTFYLSYVLRSAKRGLFFGGMLSILFACIYGLLLSEDNALLLGSLMLFAILAAIMVVTRKVDWYRAAVDPAGVPPVSGGPVAAAQVPTASAPVQTPWQRG